MTLNLSDVFSGYSFRVVDANNTTQRMGVSVTLAKGQPASSNINYFRYSFDGNEITFEATNNGA